MAKQMDKNMRAAEELLLRECRGLSSCKTIERLGDLGVLSHRACKAYLARREVATLMQKGMLKMDAIEVVAEQMGASRATICGYIYHKFND